jgi:hypothetical protein
MIGSYIKNPLQKVLKGIFYAKIYQYFISIEKEYLMPDSSYKVHKLRR